MTATDELRRLLDGRGVAWRAAYYSPENVTEFKVGGIRFRYIESSKYDDFCWIDTDRSITPQQAVEATLGRGECQEVKIDRYWRGCGECGYVWEFMYGIGKCERPRYCPNCGRKVRA